jgi:hypothetical protein
MIDDYSFNFPEFERQIVEAENKGGLNAQLELIFTLVNSLVASREFKEKKLFLPKVDQHLINLQSHPETQSIQVENVVPHQSFCILATEVYSTGGHGKVLNQIAETYQSHVFFTDIFRSITGGRLSLDGLVCEAALSVNLVLGRNFIKKLKNLMGILQAIKPKGIILLGHHQDVIAEMAGLLYCKGERTIFVHHADHDPAIGASIKRRFHLDFTDLTKTVCEEQGVHTDLISLSAPIPTKIRNHPSGYFRVATCGTENNFIGENDGIFYLHILRQILSASQLIQYFHIGPLSKGNQEIIAKYLSDHGIDSTRFISVGPVTSLANFLHENNIDVFLSPFPIPSYLAITEAQSLGIPVIYESPDRTRGNPLTGCRSVFSSRDLEWDSIDQKPSILNFVFQNWTNLNKNAIDHYHRNNHPDVFNKLIKTISDRL